MRRSYNFATSPAPKNGFSRANSENMAEKHRIIKEQALNDIFLAPNFIMKGQAT